MAETNVLKWEDEALNYDGKDKIISSFEMLDKFNALPAEVVYKSGIKGLDDLTEGFTPGQVITVSGYPKCGKTSFCQTLTTNYYKQDYTSLWFTYELTVREFFKKFPSLPLFFLPQVLAGNSCHWVEKKILEAKLKNDIKFVFLDHLHFLVPFETKQNTATLIGGIMRQFKLMALRHNIVFFVLTHNKQQERSKDSDVYKIPDTEDLRDSGFIAAESDFVLMMSRKKYKPDDPEEKFNKFAKLRVAENRRNGQRGCVGLDYRKGFYVEIDLETLKREEEKLRDKRKEFML